MNDTCAGGACAGTDVDCSGLNDACNVGVCDPNDGSCVTQPANEGGPCDDGLLCTESDACAGGSCIGSAIPGCQKCGSAGECDDGNPCTTGICPAGICLYVDNADPCDDGDATC